MQDITSAPCLCTCKTSSWNGNCVEWRLLNSLISTKGPVLDPFILVAGSVHGTNDYIRWVGRSQEERSEQRKAARLCLDTSAHDGTEFQRLMTVLSNVSGTLREFECSVRASQWDCSVYSSFVALCCAVAAHLIACPRYTPHPEAASCHACRQTFKAWM